jgi:SWI/SNF-related matrix-associated actin-dependent regulator 1 of chromatin subfamily A
MWWPEYSGPISVVRSRKDVFDTRGIVIVSYNLASSGALGQWRWDFLILDEAHACKNPASNTSRACLVTIWNSCRYRLAMTGTPVPNGRAFEAWTLFSRLLPSHFGESSRYIERYCIPEHTDWGVTYPHSKNLEELGRIAREHFMVRRRREEILSQLPDLIRCRVPLEVPRLKVQEAVKDLDVDTEEVVYSIDMNIPLRSDALSTARRKLGILKVEPAIEFLKSVVLEETNKVVVFCHHREVFFPLLEGLKREGVVSINGTTSLDDRQRAIDAFQNDDKVRVFLASITAASTGITLTAASTVVFIEADWVPSVNEQAEGRINRIGQRADLMRAIYLVVPDSLDEAVMWSVHRKQRNIGKIMHEKRGGTH